jgi:thiol:disulfide interchange protein DsbD
MRFFVKTKIFTILLLLSLPAHAGHVASSFLYSAVIARPGDSFIAGLRLRMKEGWHVYWRNPGDAGLAGVMAYKLMLTLSRKIRRCVFAACCGI